VRNLLLVAGEASGDLYGAALAREIRRLDPSIRLWGCGGERMAREGVEIVYSLEQFSVMGFSEVVGRIPFFLGALRRMARMAEERRPAAAVPIDFPGFNLRLAGRCRRAGIPVVYYVSPQVWAWGRWRVARLRRVVREMLVILPFEEEFFRNAGVPVRFTGHPLVDLAKPVEEEGEFRRRIGAAEGEKVIGLFPGSRRQEVLGLLPAMAETARRLREEGFPARPVIGAAPAVGEEVYREALGGEGPPLLRDRSYDLLRASAFALVASGTMTVEAAVLGTPMAILYRVSALSYAIGRALVRVPHVGMANLLAAHAEGRWTPGGAGDPAGRAAPEFLQGDASAEKILPVARGWLRRPEELEEIRRRLGAVREILGGGGASARAAEAVLEIAAGGKGR